MKVHHKISLSALLALAGIGLGHSVHAQAVDLLINQVQPRAHIIADCSGSMNASVGGPGIPGCVGSNCDNFGIGGSRMDYTVAVIRGLMDTNNSAASGVPPGFGSTASIDAGDSWGVRFGLLNFQWDHVVGIPSTAPTIKDVLVCPTNTSYLRYRIRETTSNLTQIETALQSFKPDGDTPIGASFRFMRTDSDALPWFGVPGHDPAFACRKQNIILITDGDDTCEPGSPLARATSVVNEGQLMRDLYSGPNKVKIFTVGFLGPGLTQIGKGMLNELAKVGGTDANMDNDGDPATGCYLPGADTCFGNAYLVADSQQLVSALRTIFDQITSGTYSLSLPRLTLSGDGTGGVIAAYFHVNQYANYPWTPGLLEKTLDSGGQPTVLKWDAVSAVSDQPASGAAPNVRKNYSITETRAIVELNDSSIVASPAPGKFAQAEFFPTSDPVLDDFDLDGTFGSLNDARNIGRFLNGREDKLPSGPLKWKIGAQPDYENSKFPFGSIFHAQPLVVTHPNTLPSLGRPGYIQFIADKAGRDRLVIIGTNSTIVAINDPAADDSDGPQLPHAQGEMVWSYTPRLNFPKYRRINYQTTLYNDGNGVTLDYNAGTEAAPNWQTGFWTGLGLGGRGVVAINVTDPSLPGNNTTTGNWEFTDGDLGYTTAPPTLLEVRDHTDPNIIHPVLVVPGGSFDSSDLAHPLNARYIYFINAIDGTLVRKLPIGEITDPHFVQYTPAGMTTKAAPVDMNNDGFADQIYVGTAGGQVYRFTFNDKDDISNSLRPAELVWESREYASVTSLGDGTNPVDCTIPGNPNQCDMMNPTDLPVANVLPYFDRNLKLRVAVYFGVPEGSDLDNMPAPIRPEHPKGPILRILKVDPTDIAAGEDNYNDEVIFHEDAGDPAKQVYGDELLPRQLYVDIATQRADRILSWPSMFVLNHKIYYLLYRPDPDPCGSVSMSYFAAIDLDSGVDANVTNPNLPPPTQDPNDASTENYLQIGSTPASFVVDFAHQRVTFAWADTGGLHLQNNDLSLGGPFNGALQSIILSGGMM